MIKQVAPFESAKTTTVSTQTLELICDRMRKWSGVSLDQSKAYLINNRLRSIVTEFGVGDLSALISLADRPDQSHLRDRIVDLLTTHETLFFRDRSPFDVIHSVIVPEARASSMGNRPRLRIWLAACSTGQEPYSIAIQLLESIPDIERWDISILAEDVSRSTIEQAQRGCYQDHEIKRGLDESLQRKYFTTKGDYREILPKVRNMVRFQVGNLLSANLSPGPFDLIFCRNVLIYFERPDAMKILRALEKRLAPGGRLFVGCSEILNDATDFLVPNKVGNATCYQRLSKPTISLTQR